MTKPAIPLAEPNIPKAVCKDCEEAEYENVAQSEDETEAVRCSAILQATKRYGSRLDSMAN
jgi:hypothetical protein